MCTIFGVPRITLAELRDMLRDGTMSADLEKWVKRMTTDFRIVSAGINPRPGLIPAKHNFFVSVSGLMATVSEAAVKNTADLDGEASSKIGAKIFGDYSHLLESNCQIGYRRHGESIVQVCCGSPYVARCGSRIGSRYGGRGPSTSARTSPSPGLRCSEARPNRRRTSGVWMRSPFPRATRARRTSRRTRYLQLSLAHPLAPLQRAHPSAPSLLQIH